MMSPMFIDQWPGSQCFSPCPHSACAGVRSTSLKHFYMPDFIKSFEQISEPLLAQKCPWGLKVNVHCWGLQICKSNLWLSKTSQTPSDPVSLLTNLFFLS